MLPRTRRDAICVPRTLPAWQYVAAVVLLLAAVASHAQAPVDELPLPGAYDPDNRLARTARGEIESIKLYEDDEVLAFLGEHPASRGHFLVISRTSKARNFLELSPDELAHILEVAQIVAKAEIIALGAEGFTLRQNNGSASSIAQFHLHVLPRYRGDTLPQGMQPPGDLAELRIQAEKIRASIRK